MLKSRKLFSKLCDKLTKEAAFSCNPGTSQRGYEAAIISAHSYSFSSCLILFRSSGGVLLMYLIFLFGTVFLLPDSLDVVKLSYARYRILTKSGRSNATCMARVPSKERLAKWQLLEESWLLKSY